MRRLTYSNPKVTATPVLTTLKIVPGSTTITLDDASSIQVGDLLLIEEVGSERNEIREVTAVNDEVVTLDKELLIYHEPQVKVYQLDYDMYVIKDSEANVLLEEKIDYASKTGGFEYTDLSEENSFSIFYKNSSTDAEVVQKTTTGETVFAFVDVEELSKEFKVTKAADKAVLYFGLSLALERIQDAAFKRMSQQIRGPNYFADIPVDTMSLTDWNGDAEIDKSDVYVYEIDGQTRIKYYKNHLVSAIDADAMTIYFREELPALGRQLFIDVPLGHKHFKDMRQALKRVASLMTANHLLKNVETDAVRRGIISWSAGGTNVSRDPRAVEDVIKANQEEVNSILQNELIKLYAKPTRLRTRMNVSDQRFTRQRLISQHGTHLRRR